MFTGKKIYQRLQQVYKSTGQPVYVDGLPVIKPNVNSDPDYIPPVLDLINCSNTPPPVDPTTTTTTTSSTSTTTAIPVNCDDILYNYGSDCNYSDLYNRIEFRVGLPVDYVTVEVRYNKQLVDIFENLEVVGERVYFNLAKNVTGFVEFTISSGNCSRTFIGNIFCTTTTSTTSTSTSTTTTTTTTSTTTSSTTTSTSSTTSSSTTSSSTTTTTSTSSTTISQCTATFVIQSTTPCAEDNSGTYAVLLEQSGGGVVTNIQYGASEINNVLTVTNWQNSGFLILDGDGITKYIFVRYGTSQQCRQLIAPTTVNCTGTTSTSTTSTSSTSSTTSGSPTTTTSSTTTTVFTPTTTTTSTTTSSSTTLGCAGSATINSVTVPTNVQILANITTALSNINWKVKLSGSTLAGNAQAVTSNPQTINLSSITLTDGVTYQLFIFGDNCLDGTGFDFVWNNVTTTTTSTTTSGGAGCSGVAIEWRYNGQAGLDGLPYASEADALSASCFAGSGCTGYVNSPTVGQTFYKDKDPSASCTFNGCSVLPTGWYWIYPLADINDVYIVHVVDGVIDDVTANPCE